MSFTTELRVPPDSAFSSLVQNFTADAAQRGELTTKQAHDLVAAAAQGFTAIVVEALAESREPIHFIAACTAVDLRLSIFERGLPIDDALARRDPRWQHLIESVDSAHWRMHGAAGSELQLVARRPPKRHSIGAPSEQKDVDVPLAPPQDYTIRRFEPADAPGVARAFYWTYGYEYDLPAVYEPARLTELNESARYVSIVALSSDGDVVGHYALARESDEQPIADACGAIVLPAHRGRELLNRLREAAEAEAIVLGLAAYYSEPVTDHARTQHASESFGAKACGITLGEAPRSFIARHMQLSTTKQRQSCMLYVKPLQSRAPRVIYAPEHHRTIIESIYHRLALPITVRAAKIADGPGCFRESIVRSDKIGNIEITAVGRQTGELVRQAADDLCATSRLGALYASLPLEDPGTPALCSALEAYGFFFSGVGPWMLDGHDALRLQMPLTAIDLSALVVIGDFGKRLLDYVASEREHGARNRDKMKA